MNNSVYNSWWYSSEVHIFARLRVFRENNAGVDGGNGLSNERYSS